MTACAAILVLLQAMTVQGGENIVANGSFEEADGSAPRAWTAAGGSDVKQTLTTGAGHAGNRSARLECSAISPGKSDGHAMLAQLGTIGLAKERWYVFSCWLRAEGLRSRQVHLALKNTRTWDDEGLSAEIVTRPAWRKFEHSFKASRDLDPKDSRLQFWFAETGTLWVDDVSLTYGSEPHPVFTRTISRGASSNLLPNGSFEAGPDGWTSMGETTGWGNLTGLYGQVQEGGAFHGGKCLKIELGTGLTPVTYFDYFNPARVEQRAPLAANLGWIQAERGKWYVLSAWMRADRDRVPALMKVIQCDPASWQREAEKAVELSREWKRYELAVTAEATSLFVALGPDLRKYRGSGARVWLDAVQVEEGRNAGAFVPREPVEIGVTTGLFGNVLPAGKPPILRVCGYNGTDAEASVRLTGTARDFFGNSSPLPALTLSIPRRGSAAGPWPVQSAVRGKGHFRLEIAWETGGRRHRRDLTLAVLDSDSPADSPFGVNHAPANAELSGLMRRAGVAWARDWSLKWQDVEPRPGAFTFEVTDPQIDRLAALGFKTVCLLPPFPSSNWASSAPAGTDTSGYPGVRRLMSYAPKDPALLARFIGKTIEHYRDRVKVWEFLNEPVYTDYSLPGPGQRVPGAAYTIRDYASLLAVAYTAMKKADPACRVVAGIGCGPGGLVSEFIEAGGLNLCDALNLHIYPSLARPESFIEPMTALRRDMEKRGRPKPVWVTEYSYYGADEKPWEPFVGDPNDWAGTRLLEDEKQAADFSVRFAVVMIAGGAEKIFYHSGASAGPNVEPLECCLIGAEGRPRKACAAQSEMARRLGSRPKFVRRIDTPCYAFLFKTDSGSLIAAWSDGEETAGAKVGFVGPAVAAFDIMGNPLAPGSHDLGDSPVYLTGGELDCESLARACSFSPSGGN